MDTDEPETEPLEALQLYVDTFPGEPDTVVVWRPVHGHDLLGQKVAANLDAELKVMTDDWLTLARARGPDDTVVYELHVAPAVAAWIAADREAELAGRDPVEPTEGALDEWDIIRETHGLGDPEEDAAYGLPATPARAVRGPGWTR